MNTRLFETIGEEVTWTFYGSEGRWLVTASHTGSDDPRDDFKFSASDAELSDAVTKVAVQVLEDGPAWIRDQII